MEQQRERLDVAMVISGRTWTPPPPQSPIHGLSMSSWGVKFSAFGGQNNFHGCSLYSKEGKSSAMMSFEGIQPTRLVEGENENVRRGTFSS